MYSARDLAHLQLDMGVFAALPIEIQVGVVLEGSPWLLITCMQDEIRDQIRETRQLERIQRRVYMQETAPVSDRPLPWLWVGFASSYCP
jgi:hypothetical protein